MTGINFIFLPKVVGVLNVIHMSLGLKKKFSDTLWICESGTRIVLMQLDITKSVSSTETLFREASTIKRKVPTTSQATRNWYFSFASDCHSQRVPQPKRQIHMKGNITLKKNEPKDDNLFLCIRLNVNCEEKTTKNLKNVNGIITDKTKENNNGLHK